MSLKSKKTPSRLLIFSTVFFVFIFSTVYFFLFADNIRDNDQKPYHELLIYTGSTYEVVLDQLKDQGIIRFSGTFDRLATGMHYDQHVKAGRYLIKNNMGNLQLVRMLRNGEQAPVRIVINNIQSKAELAEKISSQLECTQDELLQEFNNQHLLDSLGLTEDNFPTLFLSNTYEFYWNTSASQFIARMLKEYNKFWTPARQQKAGAFNLDPTGATILASIVQKESNHYDEYPRIAGVYINRLHIGMPLQADPTVVYALNKIGVKKRVYNLDLHVESPYNTYLHTGLPPGPICLPELKSIDEVLNAEEHDYLYFCAKSDFSGYHVFAKTWQEQVVNAKNYHQALNANNIQ